VQLEKIYTDKNGSDMMIKIFAKGEAACMLQGSVHGGAPHMSQMGENVGYPPHVGCEEMTYLKPLGGQTGARAHQPLEL
jgi:hypothetical protein